VSPLIRQRIVDWWLLRRLLKLNPSMSIETSVGIPIAWAFLGT
jgi:hypothetical protein